MKLWEVDPQREKKEKEKLQKQLLDGVMKHDGEDDAEMADATGDTDKDIVKVKEEV